MQNSAGYIKIHNIFHIHDDIKLKIRYTNNTLLLEMKKKIENYIRTCMHTCIYFTICIPFFLLYFNAYVYFIQYMTMHIIYIYIRNIFLVVA